MRNGTGYYRYSSLDDFLNGAAPETFAWTYGYNGVSDPKAQVTFNQIGFYAQDEWNIRPNVKLTYGIRFDDLIFDNSDLQRNDAIYDLDSEANISTPANGLSLECKYPSCRFRLGCVQG